MNALTGRVTHASQKSPVGGAARIQASGTPACSLTQVISQETITEGAYAISIADCFLRRNIFYLASSGPIRWPKCSDDWQCARNDTQWKRTKARRPDKSDSSGV